MILARRSLVAIALLAVAGFGCAKKKDAVTPGWRLSYTFPAGRAAEVATVLRARLQAYGTTGQPVRVDGERVLVELPGQSPAGRDDIKRLLAQGGRLRLTVVDDESTYVRDLDASAGDRAKKLGVAFGMDRWSGPGGEHSAAYLGGPRMAVTMFLGSLRPAERIDANHALVLEEQHPAPAKPGEKRAGGGRELVRSHVLDLRRNLAIGHVKEAAAARDELGDQVKVTLLPDDAGKVEELTKANLGRKLAILLDDQIVSVPVLVTPFLGGHLSLGVRGGENEARLLAACLTGGALPLSPTMISEETVAAR